MSELALLCHQPAFDESTELSHEQIRIGSVRLAKALRRNHPERFKSLPRGLPLFGKSLLSIVSASAGVTVEALIGPDRNQRLVHLRAVIAATLRARNWSYPQIGKLMQRDHSSIINQCEQLEFYMRRNPECAALYDDLAPYRVRP